MKKLLIPLSMIASSAIFAGDLDSRVAKSESSVAQTTTQSYTETTITKSAPTYPVVKDAYHIKFEIGAVYQTIQVGRTEFGFAFTAEALDGDNYPYIGEVLEPKSKLTWGFNVAASYIPFLEEYDLRFANSYFENHSHLKKTTNNDSNFITALNYNVDWVSDAFFDYSNSQLKIGYDLLGIELGRATAISKKLSCRPFIGFLSSWMWLNQKTTYGFADDPVLFVEKTSSQSFGVGPQVGLNTNFAISKSISFFSDSKASLLYGSFKNRRSSGDTDLLDDATPHLYYEVAKISDRKVIPYLELIIGGSYECFNKSETKHFKLRAGYHLQYFVSANQSLVYDLDDVAPNAFIRANDHISTQGLILDLACSF